MVMRWQDELAGLKVVTGKIRGNPNAFPNIFSGEETWKKGKNKILMRIFSLSLSLLPS